MANDLLKGDQTRYTQRYEPGNGVIIPAAHAVSPFSGTNSLLIITSPSSEMRVVSLSVSTNSATLINLGVWESSGGVMTLIAVIPVPAFSGWVNGSSVAVASVNLIDRAYMSGLLADAYGNDYLPLPAAHSLYVGNLTAIAANTEMHVTYKGESF